MSAYIVDRSSILGLVKGAISLRTIEPEFATSTAKMLWGENIESVLCRYPQDTLETAPGPLGETYEIKESEILSAEAPTPKRLLELIGEFNYQSCEHPGWKTSRAFSLIEALRDAAGEALIGWEAEQAKASTIAREEAHKQSLRDAEAGQHVMAGRPEQYAIIAELQQDESDSQSDYFASRTTTTIVLALSSHGKDLFSEMRKAAALMPETAHLGPGRDEWRVMKLAPAGDHRHWDGRLGEYEGKSTFGTRAEAQAFLDAALARDQAKRDAVPFMPFCPEVPNGAEIECESVEHREKYSMGKGFYLQVGSYGGWRVKKTHISHVYAAIGRGDHRLGIKAPKAEPTPAPVFSSPVLAEFASACYIG
jgi:hypothetical protein